MFSSLPTPDPNIIQRVLFVSPTVHIYTVPPLTSTKGYTTTAWTPLIAPTPSNPTPTPITTRLRVLESSSASGEYNNDNLTTTILLEDPSSGDLFAAAPYLSPSVVEAVLDSARFFAVRVEADGGKMKAVLGIGFEERSEAIDFGICLQQVRKVMGMDGKEAKESSSSTTTNGVGGKGGERVKGKRDGEEDEVGKKKNWSLKEGEMIKVEIGGMGVKRKEQGDDDGNGGTNDGEALFSIKPPPSNTGGIPFLPPPPSAQDVKAERRRSRGPLIPQKGSAADLGFDDGEFGEFQ
ncbi:MAG: hypothetical protein Q9186_003045 [Xanthomendoza sp. 1 TL-2023]